MRAANSVVVDQLRAEHSRLRTEIITGALVVGMHHLDHIDRALLAWHTLDIDAPELAGVGPVPRLGARDNDTTIQAEEVRVPEAYARILDQICAAKSNARLSGADVRAAILWIGLNHRDELAKAMAEIDEVNRTHQPGQTVIAFVDGELTETGALVGDLHYAREMLRQGHTIEQAATAANMSATELAAITAETTDHKDGGTLALTG